MDLRALHYFAVVAEELNITRAAERLNMSQPPLSAQIKGLEEELGVQLFIRGKRHLTITDAGTHLYRRARQILELSEQTQQELMTMEGLSGDLNISLVEGRAPYLLARAQVRLNLKKYRDAVNDLNDYEQLMAAQINARFYYIRSQAEIEGRLYQQALNDLTKAITMEPKETLYHAEMASLQIRVGQYDEALATAEEIISIEPQGSDGYLFKGLAQCLKGDKKNGIPNLQKAKDLGDPQAEGLIEKYK